MCNFKRLHFYIHNLNIMKTVIILLLCMLSCVLGTSKIYAQIIRSGAQSETRIPLVNNSQLSVNFPSSQAFPTVVVNMNPYYNNTTLPSIATAVPAILYIYAPSTNLKYRFSIRNVTTNITAADIIQTSRFVNIPLSILAYNAQYTIKASAVIDGQVLAFAGNTITIFTPSFPLITLSQAICGSTLETLTSTISANPGLNATAYTFRIRLTGDTSGTNFGYSSSPSQFVGADTFTGFPLLYGTSYNVAVQYTFPDPSTGLPINSGYGGECTIYTPKFPLTNLVSPACDSQVASFNATISALPAPYATFYQFRIRKTSDPFESQSYYYTIPNPSRFSLLTAFGITLAYNTSYSISVRYSISNNIRALWSGFGQECIITTPLFPTTSLIQSQCGLITATSLTQQLNIIPYPGFPNYKVKLEEITGASVTNSQELVFIYSYFSLNQFSIAQPGKNYKLSVAIKLNGEFGTYSTACDLFTSLSKNSELSFKARAYPNPFSSNFMIDLQTRSSSAVNLKVYDMVGRLIEQREVKATDVTNAEIGDEYRIGVYNVIISQEDNSQIVRVVKR